MPRIARIVVPGYPHHVTQRGNRRQPTFFGDEDYKLYRKLMAHWCTENRVAVWAYCLMPNHVHLVLVPSTEDGLRLAVGEAHRRYSRHVNFREDWRGHLWQDRFGSCVMDEEHLLAATVYVERNPVRAGLCKAPGSTGGAAPPPTSASKTTNWCKWPPFSVGQPTGRSSSGATPMNRKPLFSVATSEPGALWAVRDS